MFVALQFLKSHIRGFLQWHMSCFMRKQTICICENKDADQLRGNREADQSICFGYKDSTILLSKLKIFSLYSSVLAQLGLCRPLSETTCTGFSTRRLICYGCALELPSLSGSKLNSYECFKTEFLQINVWNVSLIVQDKLRNGFSKKSQQSLESRLM